MIALIALLAVPDDLFEKEVRPLLAKYCLGCHEGAKAKAGVELASFRTEASVLKSRKVWQQAWRALHAREMPPEEKPQPSAAERDRLTDWIEAMLRRPDPDGRRDPGRVLLRRLTRAEYSNSVADLIPSVAPRAPRYFDPAKGFPEK